MNKIKLMGLLACVGGLLMASPASWARPTLRTAAYQRISTSNVSGSFVVSQGGSYSVGLGAYRYIKKIVVQGMGLYQDSTVQVVVNGDIKGTIHFPGRDPNYVVTIEDTASSIEFYQVTGGSAQVYRVDATMSEPCYHPVSGVLSEGSLSTASELAGRAIELVDGLRDYSSADEFKGYLLPIKKIAARAKANADARGDLSQKVAALLVQLRLAIDASDGYLDQTFERDAAFDLAMELLALRERIDALLQ